jgi:hypothetical protein
LIKNNKKPEQQISARSSEKDLPMVYTVFFNPTKEHYKALQKLGSALARSDYPVVSRSGFRSPEEAESYIQSQYMPGWSRESFRIEEGSHPNPDLSW